jgi:inorganic phosphate transporter, PiT family
MSSEVLLVIVVVTALAFDFTNGFHDTANAMATTIATKALPPKVAVGVGGVLNFVGAFISLKVAATIAEGLVSSSAISLGVVFAALVGAIVWNLVTWYLGLPSSSSYALIGGTFGATLLAAGTDAVDWSGVVSKVMVPAVVAPLLGATVAAALTFLAYRIVRRSSEQSMHGYRWGQIGSSSLVALSHGTNDAQKTMGVITLALVANGNLPASGFEVPVWVILAAATAMGLGTYVGGWRLIRTLGQHVTDIEPPQGFSAETAGASVIFASSALGFPLSTTHVVSGSVVGSGFGRFERLRSVHWNVALNIVVAWLLTLPGAATLAALAIAGLGALGNGVAGTLSVATATAIAAAALFWASWRTPVTPANVNE